MNAKECQQHAAQCAVNAAAAADEKIALEFLKMAAQWRAVAVRQIFLGRMDTPSSQPDFLVPAPSILSL
jgi:hypothetical protein